MKPGSQTERLLAFLRENPGSSSLEVTLALGIVNVTGRCSDLRAEGYRIDCHRRERDHRLAYWLIESYDGTLGLDKAS
jgi:hypothetical protein